MPGRPQRSLSVPLDIEQKNCENEEDDDDDDDDEESGECSEEDEDVNLKSRPKRSLAARNRLGDQNSGLHWKEQQQLQKALLASINSTKRKTIQAPAKNSLVQRTIEDTASRDSTDSSGSTMANFRVRAQRKFASNVTSLPNSPAKHSPRKLILPQQRKAKTEDFLTFLCLRSYSHDLPPHLDFYTDNAIDENEVLPVSLKRKSDPVKTSLLIRQKQVRRAIQTAALAAKRRNLKRDESTSPSKTVESVESSPLRRSSRRSSSPYKRSNPISSPSQSPVTKKRVKRCPASQISTDLEADDVSINGVDVNGDNDTNTDDNDSDIVEDNEDEVIDREWRKRIGTVRNRHLHRDRRVRVKSNENSPKIPQFNLVSKQKRGRPRAIRTQFSSPVKQINSISSNNDIPDIPCYHPSSEQFHDAIAYIESIRPDAEKFGMCKIIPPMEWQPECTIGQDLRVIPHNQYIQRLKKKHAPVDIKLEEIKSHSEYTLKRRAFNEFKAKFNNIPTIGGIEIDLVNLLDLLKQNGGVNEVSTKNKWSKITNGLRLHGNVSILEKKLFEAYCTYLISYDGLSPEDQLECEEIVRKRLIRRNPNLGDPIQSGKSKSLAEFFKMAQNISTAWFPNQAILTDIENEFWSLVDSGERHVCVQGAHMDSITTQTAFPTDKSSAFSKHSWNLHYLQSSPSTLLSLLGKVCGISCTSLHLAMMFTASCWQRTPHHLPYIHYVHTGEPTIWYCVPPQEDEKLKDAIKNISPHAVLTDGKHSGCWLPEDTVMIHPRELLQKGIKVYRTVQNAREFVVVFSSSFTETVSSGYSIAESLHYATADWIPTGMRAMKALRRAEEVCGLSMEKFLWKIACSTKTTTDVLWAASAIFQKMCDNELQLRQKVLELGVKDGGKRRFDRDKVCNITNAVCFFSYLEDDRQDFDSIFCLEKCFNTKDYLNRSTAKHFILYKQFDDQEIVDTVQNLRKRLQKHH